MKHTYTKRYNHLLSEIDSVYHDTAVKQGISDSVSMILYTIYVKDDDLEYATYLIKKR